MAKDSRTSRTIGVVGIDGCGKTSVIRRFVELSTAPATRVATMTCPAYHETPDLPFERLSRQLDVASKSGDALGSFELKATAMYLQMTLFGPVEQFVIDAYRPQFLLSEHHPIIDTVAYSAFYAQMVKNPIDAAVIEPKLRARLDALGPGGFAAIERWHALEQDRVGERAPLWDLALRVRDIFTRPRAEQLAELSRRFRTRLPDVLLILDLPVAAAIARLEARGDKQGELHEQTGVLELLRKSYHELGSYFTREHPEVETHIIDTVAAGSIDDNLREVIARSGIG